MEIKISLSAKLPNFGWIYFDRIFFLFFKFFMIRFAESNKLHTIINHWIPWISKQKWLYNSRSVRSNTIIKIWKNVKKINGYGNGWDIHNWQYNRDNWNIRVSSRQNWIRYCLGYIFSCGYPTRTHTHIPEEIQLLMYAVWFI